MKRILIFITIIYVLLLALTGSAWSQMARVKEYHVQPRVTTIELSSFLGSIKWIPITSQEQARIIVEVIADGVSQTGVRNALLQVRIVENIRPSSILLEARRPALPSGVDYVEVNYTVYAPPGQFRQFKAQTAHRPIEIVSGFNAELTLINHNAPITLHSGRGAVNLQTTHAPIMLGKLDLAFSSQVQADHGAISGVVSFPPQGSFLFKTTNAPIELRVPQNTLGTFYLSSTLGAIDFQLGDDIYNGSIGTSVEGSAEPVISIITSNSTITVNEIH